MDGAVKTNTPGDERLMVGVDEGACRAAPDPPIGLVRLTSTGRVVVASRDEPPPRPASTPISVLQFPRGDPDGGDAVRPLPPVAMQRRGPAF